MHSFYGVERASELRRRDMLEQAADERRALRALAERSRRPRPQVRVGRLVLEFGARIAGSAGSALRPAPRKTA
jgi:hypothetical protein